MNGIIQTLVGEHGQTTADADQLTKGQQIKELAGSCGTEEGMDDELWIE